jgi:hypothetical protein
MMIGLKNVVIFTKVTAGIALISGVTASFAGFAVEEPLTSTLTDLSPINRPNGTIRVIFQPPDEKEPDNTVGGASRDGGGVCLADENLANSRETPIQEFLPLTPQNNYGLTIAERPTFYAYIPQTQAQKVFVTIRDYITNNIV